MKSEDLRNSNDEDNASTTPIASVTETSTPLAIIGIGCLFPRAQSARAFWLNIKNGVDAVGPVPSTHWNPEEYLHSDPKSPDHVYTARGAFLDPVDFNPLDFGIAPNDLEAIDTSQLLGLVAAKQALIDAGYDADRNFDRSRISVILGVTGTLELVIPLGARLGHPRWRKALKEAGVDPETTEDVVARIADSYVGWQENSFPGLLGNVVAGRIANKLDLGGTNCVVDAACASSLSAVHLAGLELAAGRCDVAVTGGIDTFNDIFMYMCFSKTPALSPTGNAKPFEASGDGTILGEGLGIVILKRLADAQRDGDRVYAVIRSIGSSSDGKGNAIYAPSVNGQIKALKTAYQLAGVTPDTIELVEGHGTGTKVGDTVEATALSSVYKESEKSGTWCAVGSVKSQIGHTKAAAGSAGLIKAALALHYKTLPPTIKVRQPVDPFLKDGSPLYVNTERRPWIGNSKYPRRAAVSAFGFGGSNFHCVLEEAQSSKNEVDWDGQVEILAFSGPTPQSIADQLELWPNKLDWAELRRRAWESRAEALPVDGCRLLIVIQQGSTDIAKLIATAQGMLSRNPQNQSWHSPDGVYFGKGSAAGTLAVLFPGQGSQYVGMFRELACQFPQMQDVLADANRVFERMQKGEASDRLSDLIYPIPVFTPEKKADQEHQLRDTQIAQPAIGAVSLGALKVLEWFGLQPEAFAGHSYGELPALCAAGCFEDQELHQLSRLRGHLMASFHSQDAGAMLAVHSPVETIENFLQEEDLRLVIANRNSPHQSVLSGSTVEIDRALERLTNRKIRHTRLAVAAAFHSPLVAPAQVPFREALEAVPFRQSRRPVFANSSSRQYPDDPNSMRELLAEQLAKPVDFVRQIGNMASTGVRTFLEVGPGSTLTRLVESILKSDPSIDKDWDAFAVDASSGKRSGTLDLAHTLARLAARGHSVSLRQWENAPEPASVKKSGLVVPICGSNYVKPRTLQERKPKPSPIPSTQPPARSEGKSMINPTPASNDKPASPLTTHSPDGSTLSHALQVTQQSLTAFQKLQEQTAQLHKQFLSQQEAAQKTLQILVEQQQAIILTGMGAIAQAPKVLPSPTIATSRISPVSVPAPVEPQHFHSESVPSPPSPAQQNRAPVVREVPRTPPSKIPEPPKTSPLVEVEKILLTVVAEKTGYPVEMLSPEMALDSDLGIDSIKRVEILSALQDRLPNAPAVRAEQLGTFHTLRDIIAFLSKPVEESSQINVPVPKLEHPEPVLSPVLVNPEPMQGVEQVLLTVVAEKTGYPIEMLLPEMSLDADLGIDSIKRVEILSTLQERLPHAPAVKPDQLGTFRTLRDIIGFLNGSLDAVPLKVEPTLLLPRSTPIVTAPVKEPPVQLEVVSDEQSPTKDQPEPAPTLAPIQEPGGIHTLPDPAPSESSVALERSVLRRVPLDLKKPRRKITLPKGSIIWVVSDPSSLTAKLTQLIDSLGYRPQFIPWNDSPYAFGPRGVAGLIMVAPEGLLPEDFHIRAFRWMKHASTGLLQAARHDGAVFAAITRLDGSFGLGNLDAARDPVQGVLPGLVKTAAREWPDVTCKVIDCEPTSIRQLLVPVIEEIFLTGPREVGITLTERFGLELKASPLSQEEFTPLLDEKDVVLITGGARGVTAAAAQAIAESCRSTLVLLGRTAKSDHEPNWLASLTSEVEIKKAMAERLGPDLTPRELEKKYRQLLSQREVRATISRLQTAGSKVIYWPVDVQDLSSVQLALAEIRKEVGKFTAVIHGAGVLADRRIEDLTDDQFESVYSTKVIGLRNILSTLGDDPLKALVLFSSSTGRMGRAGQSAYAAANEVLNKVAQQQARLRSACRVVSINWGPWEGGMVTPPLQKMFEQEGVAVIPLRKGGDILVRELSVPDRSVETIVIGRMAEPHSTLVSEMAPAVPSMPGMTPAFERVISLQDHSILRSHVIDGRAVLPMAIHLEWLAHAALHGNPGMVFQGVNDLRIHQGVYLDEFAPATIRVLAGKTVKRDGTTILVPVELRGRKDHREVIHSRAEIVLGSQLLAAEKPMPVPELQPFVHSVEHCYRALLFHGPQLAGIDRIDGISDKAIVGVANTAPAPLTWMENPLRGAWLTDPLVMDCAYQMMILWSFAQHGAGSLPCFFGKYRQYRKSYPSGLIRLVGQVKRDTGSLARADIDFLDLKGELVARMQDYEFVIDRALNEAFRRNHFPTISGK